MLVAVAALCGSGTPPIFPNGALKRCSTSSLGLQPGAGDQHTQSREDPWCEMLRGVLTLAKAHHSEQLTIHPYLCWRQRFKHNIMVPHVANALLVFQHLSDDSLCLMSRHWNTKGLRTGKKPGKPIQKTNETHEIYCTDSGWILSLDLPKKRSLESMKTYYENITSP